MTKEEWSKVQTALGCLHNAVKLKIDGYSVTLSLVRVGTYKNAIAVYVDEQFKGKWLMEDCEERRRFLPKKERSLLSAKEKANWKKLSKKSQKEFAEIYDRKYEYYQSHWSSFGTLKKHLTANNESIELVQIGFEG